MTKDEALLIGIDALENAENIIFSEWGGNCDEYQDAIKIMKEALKQEQGEPVAWMTTEANTGVQVWLYEKTAVRYRIAVKETGSTTRVSVTDDKGNVTSADNATRILSLLNEQLK